MDFLSSWPAIAGQRAVLPTPSDATWTYSTEVTTSFGDSFVRPAAKDFKRVEVFCRAPEGSGTATVTLQVEVRTPPQALPVSKAEDTGRPWGPLDARGTSERK